MKDDRAEFAELQRQRSAELAADQDVQATAVELAAKVDEHDYAYVWNWMGVPIIQFPADIVTMQELIWDTRPQLIIETGVARGGSVLMYASILQLLGDGEVLGIDIDIRGHNRGSIEQHPMAHRVRLIEGSSVDPDVVAQAARQAARVERVMVVLDSNHTHEHVLDELRAYGPLVTPGQYLVVADTSVEDLPPAPHRPRPWGKGDNPATARDAYLAETDRFEIDPHVNGKLVLTSSPGGYLRCIVP